MLVASTETGLEVSDAKTEYMAMPREQNATQTYNIKTGNKTFEIVQTCENNSKKCQS